jgi:hypothetical protein
MGAIRGTVLHLDLDSMLTVYPQQDVRWALEVCSRMSVRKRKLPNETMMYLIIALGLMTATGAREVLRRLLDQMGERRRVGGDFATEAAVCKARKRIGPEPLRELFERVARPVALKKTPGAWFANRRLVSLDGSTLDVQDSDANESAFGRAGSRSRKAAWPSIRFAMLIENGTRVPFAAAMGGYRTAELTLARGILGRLEPGMLCLADRLFTDYATWTRAAATGADLLWRVSKSIVLPKLEVLADGSYRSEFRPPLRGRGKAVAVRVIEFTTTIEKHAEPYRVVTTLLDPEEASAIELARLYARRWTFETALGEIKTHQRGRGVILRSRLPELVQQDFYALLLAYYGVRCLMHEAALRDHIEPTSISFLHALNVITQRLPEAVAISPCGHAALP